jgi:hypothetical protein
LRVEGPSVARLSRGRLTAKLEKTDQVDAARRAAAELPRLFTIHTPKASVHDLGTEFGVDVREAGDADVHVFDGLVELASVGAIASASDAAAFRLAAGDAARIDKAGRITSTGGGQAKKFVRAMPKPERDPRSLLERLGWNDATAEVIYRDTFTGSGQLAGSTPASRGGIGNAAWIAPPTGWALDPDRRVLVADTRSSAYLPFVVEPGHLYRMSITVDVVGQLQIPADWFAFGFSAAATPAKLFDTVPAYAWMAQRFAPSNFVFRGPATNGGSIGTDRAAGRQKRGIVLDASRPHWIASFLLGDTLVGQFRYSQPPTSIAYVGLCNIAIAHVHDFVLERSRR